MTVLIPLAVRVVTPRMDRDITDVLADLSFRSTAPGGFASARFSIHRSLALQPDDIRHFARVYIYDARNGNVMFEGRLEDPGPSAGNNGEIWDVAALGPATHTRDRVAPLIYVDTRLSPFVTATTSGRAYSVGTRDSSNADDGALSISASQGTVVTQLSLGAAVYDPVYAAGQDLALVSIQWDGGFSSVNTQVQLRTAEDSILATTTLQETDVSTAGGTLAAQLNGAPDIPDNHNKVVLTLRRSGATITVSDDNYWAEFFNVAIMGTRYNADGSAKTSGYSGTTIIASDVVADLLGRLLPAYDGAGASIATTSFAIEQLAYEDGATPEKVLTDLMQIEQGYLWEALESNSAGKYRFVWRAWPTNVRYEADIDDGYSSVSSASDLYNAVRVRYRDSSGLIRNVRRTQAVAALDDEDLIREYFIDLGDEVSTEANANRIGDQFLAEHQVPLAAGRLTIARPIVDFDGGRMVQPWEIRRGHLIRVRGLESSVDAVGGTARDGTTIFKIASHEYSASDATAQLELDTSYPTMTKWISDLIERPSPRRR
jgi:hypothetical protein